MFLGGLLFSEGRQRTGSGGEGRDGYCGPDVIQERITNKEANKQINEHKKIKRLI